MKAMQPVKFVSGVELLTPNFHDWLLFNIDGSERAVIFSFQPENSPTPIKKLYIRSEARPIVWAQGLCCPMTAACVSVVIGQPDRDWLTVRLGESTCDRLLASIADWAVVPKWLVLIEANVGDAVAAFGNGPIEDALFEG